MPTNELDTWERYGYRFVAVLDIAGFKSFAKNNFESPDNIYDLLYSIKTICKRIESRGKYNSERLFYTVAISDTVIIITKDDRPKMFLTLLHIINDFFFKTFRYYRPMTGAIAYGNICVDRENTIIFGDAYQNAYSLQDTIDYYGVICDRSIDDYISENYQEFDETCQCALFEAPSHIKCNGKQSVVESRRNLRWHRFVNDILPAEEVCGDYYQRSAHRFDELILQIKSEIAFDNPTLERILGRIERTREMVNIMDPFDQDVKNNS